MKKHFWLAAVLTLPAWMFGQGADVNDTKLLSEPAISKNHIAFVYAGDLWVAGTNRKDVRRLTTDEGVESSPAFSPDGAQIAFSAQYDGNTDVYIVPVTGAPTLMVDTRIRELRGEPAVPPVLKRAL